MNNQLPNWLAYGIIIVGGAAMTLAAIVYMNGLGR